MFNPIHQPLHSLAIMPPSWLAWGLHLPWGQWQAVLEEPPVPACFMKLFLLGYARCRSGPLCAGKYPAAREICCKKLLLPGKFHQSQPSKPLPRPSPFSPRLIAGDIMGLSCNLSRSAANRTETGGKTSPGSRGRRWVRNGNAFSGSSQGTNSWNHIVIDVK